MILRTAADLVIGVHAAFVIFVVLGGLLVVRWPRLVWVHVPAAVWGVLIEFAGWTCPLTPLENYLRERSGLSTYQGDFVVINILLYWHVIRMKCRRGSG